MLALTDHAASAIRTLTTQPGMPEETGLRIASTAGDDGAPAFALSVTTEPQPEDKVLEAHGARVFMDSAVAEELDDKALDAEISAQGEVQFILAAQGG